MATFLIFMSLFVFWVENALSFSVAGFLGLGAGLSLKNISLFILFLGYLYSVKKKRNLINQNNINVFLILFGTLIIISNLVEVLSYDYLSNRAQFNLIKSQIKDFKQYIDPWFLFFVFTYIINSKKTCEYAILGLILLLVVTVMQGVVDQFTAVDLGTQKKIAAAEGRYAGFSEVNQYAAFLVLLLPLIYTLIVVNRKFTIKFLFITFFLVGFFGLIATVSRGGFIGFVFSVLFFLSAVKIFKIESSFKTVILITTIVGMSGLLTFYFAADDVSEAFRYRVFEISDPEKNFNPYESVERRQRSSVDKYTSGRLGRWSGALQLFFERPIWGHGHYNIKTILDVKPHNGYLHILVKYGLLGFFLFLLIYIKIFFELLKYIKHTENHRSRMLYLAYLSGFVGYMVCMFGVELYEPRYIFWIYTAIIFRYAQIENNDRILNAKEYLRSEISGNPK